MRRGIRRRRLALALGAGVLVALVAAAAALAITTQIGPLKVSATGEFEPRAASVPPEGRRRFTVVVEGPKNGDLVHTWSELCQPGKQPPPADFAAVYPFVTTVQGNRFRFRGGDPVLLRESLERLFRDRLSQGIRCPRASGTRR